MPRFITLDTESGIISGDVETLDAEQACLATDRAVGETRPRGWSGPLLQPRAGTSGYQVYEVPAAFTLIPEGEAPPLRDRLASDGALVGFYSAYLI